MIRQPTSRAMLYAYHTAALKAVKRGLSLPAIHEDTPQCGWFKRRLVKSGPFVAVEIWMDQPFDGRELTGPETLRCEVGGVAADPADVWTYVANNPISESEYRHMRADATWVKAHAPDEPAANPREPINLLRTPIPF